MSSTSIGGTEKFPCQRGCCRSWRQVKNATSSYRRGGVALQQTGNFGRVLITKPGHTRENGYPIHGATGFRKAIIPHRTGGFDSRCIHQQEAGFPVDQMHAVRELARSRDELDLTR